MISDEQLEALAALLFETEQESYREQGALLTLRRQGLILKLPFNRQPNVLRQAFKDMALAAYMHILGEAVSYAHAREQEQEQEGGV